MLDERVLLSGRGVREVVIPCRSLETCALSVPALLASRVALRRETTLQRNIMKHVQLEEIELGPPPKPRDATPLRSTTSNSEHTDAPAETGGGASVASGLFNMSNTILGAGMLGLPHAFSECGLGVGLVLLLVFACLAVLGLHLLSSAADIAGRPASFYGVAEKALPGSGMLIDVAIAIKCFGVATSYLIIVGDALPQAVEPFGASGALLDRRVWTVGAAAAVAPLAFLRKIDALRHTSLVALVCIGFVTLLIVLFALRAGDALDPCGGAVGGGDVAGGEATATDADGGAMTTAPCRGAVRLQTTATATVHALPTFVFAYTCHQNIVSVTNEMACADAPRRPAPPRGALGTPAPGPDAPRTSSLFSCDCVCVRAVRSPVASCVRRARRRPSARRSLSVIGGAVGLALVQYIVIACAAYLTYGEMVRRHDFARPPGCPACGLADVLACVCVCVCARARVHVHTHAMPCCPGARGRPAFVPGVSDRQHRTSRHRDGRRALLPAAGAPMPIVHCLARGRVPTALRQPQRRRPACRAHSATAAAAAPAAAAPAAAATAIKRRSARGERRRGGVRGVLGGPRRRGQRAASGRDDGLPAVLDADCRQRRRPGHGAAPAHAHAPTRIAPRRACMAAVHARRHPSRGANLSPTCRQVLHVVGATGSTTVSYLLPGLCYFRLCVRPDAPLRWAALALFLLGLVIAALSITLILVK